MMGFETTVTTNENENVQRDRIEEPNSLKVSSFNVVSKNHKCMTASSFVHKEEGGSS